MSNEQTPSPMNPPTSEDIIAQSWKEAYRIIETLRQDLDAAKIRITEIAGADDEDHHLVIVEETSLDAAIIRTEKSGEYRTRYLMLPGSVVQAMRTN